MTSRSSRLHRSGWAWALASVVLILSLVASQPAQAQIYTILHTFTSGADGANPQYWLVAGAGGNLYGTTLSGGCNPACNYGTVYKINVNGTESVVHVFPSGAADGELPSSPLVTDGVGNLYGTTQNGGTPENGCTPPPPGATGCGTVYELNAQSGAETILYNFTPTSPVQFPNGPFVLNGRKLYGAATGANQQNGDSGNGVVYELSSAGLDMLYQFTGGTDGARPTQGLIRDQTGNLYGTTYFGGTAGLGTIFKVDSAGNETILHNFAGTDGAYPNGPLVMDPTGNLYGVTYQGGASLVGTLFKLDTSNNLTVLYNFVGGSLGAYPSGNLILDGVGNFYGTTLEGGGDSDGTVYEITSAGTETVLHAFLGSPDGATPTGLLYYQGSLYGTTSAGGDPTCQCGTVYKISR